jgi:transposase InsO family protein
MNGFEVKVRCIVTEKLFDGVDIVLGMDVIMMFGGVKVTGDSVEFLDGSKVCAAGVRKEEKKVEKIEDKDFTAVFDGLQWTVHWKWKDELPVLTNQVDTYSSVNKYNIDTEVETWIEKGWLVPWTSGSEGEGEGVLPLMAVMQRNKGKVRPVLDYRELNEYVNCHTAEGIDVCDETIRRWRRREGPLKVLDLRSAYLQIRVDRELWRYQLVRYKGQTFCLTRLGFGLNCAPKIMTAIVRFVLSKDDTIQRGTDSYIDDILVDESVVGVSEVAEQLCRYGLETKPPETLDGGRVLGLRLQAGKSGELVFCRGNELPICETGASLTKRELFSMCGKLTGHYPVCGWLRTACSYVKRVSEGCGWETPIGTDAQRILEEILCRVKSEDPVKGVWNVDSDAKKCKVWCDASTLAIGVLVEVNGRVVEDASWMRKTMDVNHINVAELEAVLKGISLATKWSFKEIDVVTDSATVRHWIASVLEGDRRPRASGMSEMLVKRRLGLLAELIKELELRVTVTLVESCRNKADVLTRVNKAWLKKERAVCGAVVEDTHAKHHFGVNRSLYLARMVDPTVPREKVEDHVRQCMNCVSIDPAPEVHDAGELGVAENWARLALDVTHYNSNCYLTVIDCGPSRFALWRRISSENAREITEELKRLFRERGPPQEVLMDNSKAFRSFDLAELCKAWGVRRRFRAAYRPSGNGIVERHHRTIKRIAARSREEPEQAVFWYNLSPKEGLREDTVPAICVHTYKWRHPDGSVTPPAPEMSRYREGDLVLVKPVNARCTDRWRTGKVTGVVSESTVEVDGVPRHVLDLRGLGQVALPDNRRKVNSRETSVNDEAPVGLLQGLFDSDDDGKSSAEAEEGGGADELEMDVEERPRRLRRPPQWMADFEQ